MNDTMTDLLGELPGLMALFLDLSRQGKRSTEAAVEAVKQKHPHLFGIGREDEAIFETLREHLRDHEREMLDCILGKMREHEQTIFRLMICAMDCGAEIVEKPIKNAKRGQPQSEKEKILWQSTSKDLRLKYLRQVTGEAIALVANGITQENAAERIVERMRARRLITRSAGEEAALVLWAKLTAYVRHNILELFGVQSFVEITPKMLAKRMKQADACVAEALNRKATEMLLNNPEVFRFNADGHLKKPRSILWHLFHASHR